METATKQSISNGAGQFLPAYEDMVKSGMHFGRKKTIFHPNMKPYVYTLKDNIYILDLIKTTDSLIKAIDFLKKAIVEGKMILFVGLTKQSAETTRTAAEALSMPYVINRWLGGTLTNFKTIIGRVKYLEDLEKKQTDDGFEGFTKKEKILKEREIAALRLKFDGIRKLTRVPDIIFITSLKESQLPVREAKRAGVKVVGIVNTDSDPKQIDYPIVANDNSKKSVELILEAVRKGTSGYEGTNKYENTNDL
ncbi:MAG: 30S ribosomal protein S2 [Candidatus Yanofskybacteria bacterium]|nr:30S ribosomal protein S2 [Candidatus Yanofskybacteria bacterium]